MPTIKTLTTIEMIQRWVESGYKSKFVGKQGHINRKVGTAIINLDGSNPNLFDLDDNEFFPLTEFNFGYQWVEVNEKQDELEKIEQEMKNLARKLESIRKQM